MFLTGLIRAAGTGSSITDPSPPKEKKAQEVKEAEEEEAVVVEGKEYTGQCMCGDVSFTAKGLSDIWYCHCSQCRHLTGLYIAAAGVKRENLKISGDVNWLSISDKSNSGHCRSCGSYLFWDAHEFDTVSILAGSIDDTTGLEVKGHIYTADKGTFYEITDGLPQYEAYPPLGTR